MRAIAWSRMPVFFLGLLTLSLTLFGCPKNVEPSNKPELAAACYGVVKGGRGSGVVGGPIEGVEITATYKDKTVGPIMTDASGSFALDVIDFFPPGAAETQETLRAAEPVPVDIKFSKQGYKTQVETVTFPVTKFEEFTFYMTGESD